MAKYFAPTTFPNVTMITDKTSYMKLRVFSAQLDEISHYEQVE